MRCYRTREVFVTSRARRGERNAELDELVAARGPLERWQRGMARFEPAPPVREAVSGAEAARLEEAGPGDFTPARHRRLEAHPAALGREPLRVPEKAVADPARARVAPDRQLLDRARH